MSVQLLAVYNSFAVGIGFQALVSLSTARNYQATQALNCLSESEMWERDGNERQSNR